MKAAPTVSSLILYGEGFFYISLHLQLVPVSWTIINGKEQQGAKCVPLKKT